MECQLIELPYHGRFKYSPIIKRPDYSFPEGKRLAIYFALNIEHFAYGAGVGHSVSNPLPAPDSRTFAWRDYGNRVGVWRMYDLLNDLKVPACHLVNTSVFDYAAPV